MDEFKVCGKCNETKSIRDFNLRYGKPQPYCRECNRSYHKEHYKKHQQKYKKDALDRKWQLRANALQFVMEYAASGCELCGETDFRCLDFDHVDPGEKEHSISKMVGGGRSIKSISRELKKCRILCANCHRKHTADQFSFYEKLLPLFKNL